MPPNTRRPSIASGLGKKSVKSLRSLFEPKGTVAKGVEINPNVIDRNESGPFTNTAAPQGSNSSELSDHEILFDQVFQSNRKEFKGQSAEATQAVEAFYTGHSTDGIEDRAAQCDPNQHLNDQPTNQQFAFLTSDPLIDSGYFEGFSEHELSAVADIISDHPATFADVWSNDQQFNQNSTYDPPTSNPELGDVYEVLARLNGILPNLEDLDERLEQVKESLQEDDSVSTPIATVPYCPGYYVPPPVRRAPSAPVADEAILEVRSSNTPAPYAIPLLTAFGACISHGVESHHEDLSNNDRTPHTNHQVLSNGSNLDHREHPDVHADDKQYSGSVVADDGPCFSSNNEPHRRELLGDTPAPSAREYAPSIASPVDHRDHPAFGVDDKQDSESVVADDGSCFSSNDEPHRRELLGDTLAPSARDYAPSIASTVDHRGHPAFRSYVEKQSKTVRTRRGVTFDLPPLIISNGEDDGTSLRKSPTGPSLTVPPALMFPDSPTLGGTKNRETWYSSRHNRFGQGSYVDETPKSATLRPPTPPPTDQDGYIIPENVGSCMLQPMFHREYTEHASYHGEGPSHSFTSQHETHDDDIDAMPDDSDDSWDSELDSFLNEDWDEEMDEDIDKEKDGEMAGETGEAANLEDDNDTTDEFRDHGFSDAFRFSPLYRDLHSLPYPSTDPNSPPHPHGDHNSPRSPNLAPLPLNITKCRVGRAAQEPTATPGDGETTTECDLGTSARQGSHQLRADSFGTLRRYRQKPVPSASALSRDNTSGAYPVHESYFDAPSTTRPTTPTDEQVNRYLQKTARPMTQTPPKSRRSTRRMGFDSPVDTTPLLDPETSPDATATFTSATNPQPRATSFFGTKRLAKKASQSEIPCNELSSPKTPKTPKNPRTPSSTPKTTPTKKLFSFTGSWGRKTDEPRRIKPLSEEWRNAPWEVRPPKLRGSPPPGPHAPPTHYLPPIRQSVEFIIPKVPATYASPPQHEVNSVPLDVAPPIPPRNPRRLTQHAPTTNFGMQANLTGETWTASLHGIQRESMAFFNGLDGSAKQIYGEEKLNDLRNRTNTNIVYPSADRNHNSVKHLHHDRVWDARNLRCVTHQGNCAVCYAACCTYKGTEQTLQDVLSLPEEKREARKLLNEINMWCRSGQHSTFVQCHKCEQQDRHKKSGETVLVQRYFVRIVLDRTLRRFAWLQPCHHVTHIFQLGKIQSPEVTPKPRQTNDRCNLDTPNHSASHTAIMRTYDDTFSGEKIYPGKGKLYVRGDSKIFRFQNGKTESLFLQRKNPRRIAWTVLYRRQHKKGITEEQAKKRNRRTVKQQRGIVGASLDVIKERRSQRPEAREAARKEAIAKGKEKKATSESKKKAEKAKSAAAGARGQPGRIQSKMGSKGVPNKASGKTR